jgi:putative chitinase
MFDVIVTSGSQECESMLRAVEIVAKISPRCFANYTRALDAGDAALTQFGITTPLRMAHFLAQALFETGGGTVMFENMNYTTAARLLQVFGVGNHSAAVRPGEVAGLLNNGPALAERVYGMGNPAKAVELGNHRPGDAFRYRGGGLLQTTGSGNYQRIGDMIGVDLFGDPDLIVVPENVLPPALHEWDEGNLNAAADRNDIRTITKTINGGFNGLKDRQAFFDRIFPVANGSSSPPVAFQAAAPDDDIAQLQTDLNNLGAQPSLLVDGRFGPATEQAVREFQMAAGVKVDGIPGDVTRAAIKLRLSTIRGG